MDQSCGHLQNNYSHSTRGENRGSSRMPDYILNNIMLNKNTQGAKNGAANQKQQLSDYE